MKDFMLFSAFEVMLIMFWTNITKKLRILENDMETMRKNLFCFHNKLYSVYLERKYRSYERMYWMARVT